LLLLLVVVSRLVQWRLSHVLSLLLLPTILLLRLVLVMACIVGYLTMSFCRGIRIIRRLRVWLLLGFLSSYRRLPLLLLLLLLPRQWPAASVPTLLIWRLAIASSYWIDGRLIGRVVLLRRRSKLLINLASINCLSRS
jgi:hypothetical protein